MAFQRSREQSADLELTARGTSTATTIADMKRHPADNAPTAEDIEEIRRRIFQISQPSEAKTHVTKIKNYLNELLADALADERHPEFFRKKGVMGVKEALEFIDHVDLSAYPEHLLTARRVGYSENILHIKEFYWNRVYILRARHELTAAEVEPLSDLQVYCLDRQQASNLTLADVTAPWFTTEHLMVTEGDASILPKIRNQAKENLPEIICRHRIEEMERLLMRSDLSPMQRSYLLIMSRENLIKYEAYHPDTTRVVLHEESLLTYKHNSVSRAVDLVGEGEKAGLMLEEMLGLVPHVLLSAVRKKQYPRAGIGLNTDTRPTKESNEKKLHKMLLLCLIKQQELATDILRDEDKHSDSKKSPSAAAAPLLNPIHQIKQQDFKAVSDLITIIKSKESSDLKMKKCHTMLAENPISDDTFLEKLRKILHVITFGRWPSHFRQDPPVTAISPTLRQTLLSPRSRL